jgi:hypothetical protein
MGSRTECVSTPGELCRLFHDEEFVQYRIEAQRQKRVGTGAEMQVIGRNIASEAPIAIEQHIADIGVEDVLAIAAVANQAIDLRHGEAERCHWGFLSRKQGEQQNSGLGEVLSKEFEVGTDAVCCEFRRSARGEVIGAD